MAYLAPVLVLLTVLVVCLLLFVIATRSLRRSWYLALGCLVLTGLAGTGLAAARAAEGERLQRLLKALAMPAGRPVPINPTTDLIEVAAGKRVLVYRYRTSDEATVPTAADARRQNCAAGEIRAALELGASVEHEYSSGSAEVQRLTVRRDDCL